MQDATPAQIIITLQPLLWHWQLWTTQGEQYIHRSRTIGCYLTTLILRGTFYYLRTLWAGRRQPSSLCPFSIISCWMPPLFKPWQNTSLTKISWGRCTCSHPKTHLAPSNHRIIRSLRTCQLDKPCSLRAQPPLWVYLSWSYWEEPSTKITSQALANSLTGFWPYRMA